MIMIFISAYLQLLFFVQDVELNERKLENVKGFFYLLK